MFQNALGIDKQCISLVMNNVSTSELRILCVVMKSQMSHEGVHDLDDNYTSPEWYVDF